MFKKIKLDFKKLKLNLKNWEVNLGADPTIAAAFTTTTPALIKLECFFN
jgi:hypothetical protein